LWTPANIMGPFVREAGNGQWCFNRTSWNPYPARNSARLPISKDAGVLRKSNSMNKI
jgi:hypothetical protein